MHYRSSSRNTWEALDEFLESWKLCRKHVAKDASCLFRAVAEQVMLSQSHHLELRDLCATYIRLHPDQVQPLLSRPVEEHVQRLLDTTVFGGPAELYAIAHIFKAEVVVYQETPGNGFAGHMVASCSPLQTAVEKIQLATSHTSHYDIVYSRRQEATRAYCQSLTYNVLYSSVLRMQDVQIAAVSMLHDNNGSLGPYSDRRDSSASNSPPGCIGSLMEKLGLGDEEDKEQIAAQCEVELEDGTDDTGDKDCSHKSNGECSAVSPSSPSGPVSAVEILNAGDLPFPFRVAKCLDRNIYRNTEYDTWADFEPRHGSCDRRGLQAGVKVLVQLSAVPFKARLLALRDQHLLRTKGGATPPSSSRQEADATTTPNSTQSPTEAITAKDDGATNDTLPVSERNKLNKQDDANKPAKGEEGGEVFHGIIQEMAENKGPVNVYIEEIASRINVPYDALEPVSPSPTRSPYHKGGGGTSSPSHYPSQGYKGGPGFFHKQAGPIADYGPGRRKGRINSTSGRTAGPLSAPPIAAGGRGGRSGPRQPQNKSFGRDGNGGGPGPGDGYHRNGGGPGGGDSYHRNPVGWRRHASVTHCDSVH